MLRPGQVSALATKKHRMESSDLGLVWAQRWKERKQRSICTSCFARIQEDPQQSLSMTCSLTLTGLRKGIKVSLLKYAEFTCFDQAFRRGLLLSCNRVRGHFAFVGYWNTMTQVQILPGPRDALEAFQHPHAVSRWNLRLFERSGQQKKNITRTHDITW